jgi:hypothetical protein
MDADEFAEWMAIDNIEPFGDDWKQAGTVAAATQQIWTKQRITPEQFMPIVRTARKSAEDIQSELKHFAALHNAKIEKLEQRGG